MAQSWHRIPHDPGFWTAVFTGILAVTAVVALVVGYRQLKEFHAEAQVQHLLALASLPGGGPLTESQMTYILCNPEW